MPLSRLPREFLSCWLPESRLTNYNQSYSRTVLKSLSPVGIWEHEWPFLASGAAEWNEYISQTSAQREKLRQQHGVTLEEVSRMKSL